MTHENESPKEPIEKGEMRQKRPTYIWENQKNDVSELFFY